jgi:chitodextrinase
MRKVLALSLTVCLSAALAVGLSHPQKAVAQTASDPVIAAAGDIACAPPATSTSSTCHQQATANLLTKPDGTALDAVLPVGDTQYNCGELSAFGQVYDPTWGQVKSISHPAVGDNEYAGSGCTTPGASGYFTYFGAAASPLDAPSPDQPCARACKGYYSYDLGSWHIIALNTECGQTGVGGCKASSPQGKWLAADLAAHPAACTLAYWHRPYFNDDGTTSSSPGPLVKILYAAGADVLLVGHKHFYERFAPMDPSRVADPNGIRQFIVGTGGKSHGSLATTPPPNAEARDKTAYGILRLTLHAGSYDWQFLPEAGKTFTDSGSDTCHGGGADTTPPTAPTGLTATAPSSAQVNLSWTASTDTVGVTGYRIYRNGAFLANTGTTTSFTDATAAAGTTYSYQVSAVDAAANESARSNSASVTTPPSPGTLTFDPTDDAYVEQAAPTTNFGAATRLVADNSPVDHFLVRFDVAFTGCTTITAASLRLTVGSGSSDNSPSGGNFFTTGTGWNEATVTWNTAPAAGTAVGSLGAVAISTTYSLDVTQAVTGPGPVAFRVSSTSSDGVRYFSKQGSTTQAPKLVITCS